MPGCLSSVSQQAINNSGLRSLVLYRAAENESHLEVCSALSMPFSRQSTKAHRPETCACTYFIQEPWKKKEEGSLFALQRERETSQLPSFSSVHMSVGAPVSFSGNSTTRALSEQLLRKLAVITSVIFLPASKLASCPSAICKWRRAAPPPHAACGICSAAATWPQHGRAGSAGTAALQTSLRGADSHSKQTRHPTGTGCPPYLEPGLVVLVLSGAFSSLGIL